MKTIYLYESVPTAEGEAVQHYEIEQNVSDLPLKTHPETHVPIRRVILGGWGSTKPKSGSAESSKNGGCCCGPGECC